MGEPWNTRAVRAQLGILGATDLDIWPTHPEKVLRVSAAWAEKHPKTHVALVRALLEACALCDDPEYRLNKLPALLARPEFVGGSVEDFSATLAGRVEHGQAEGRSAVAPPAKSGELIRFANESANLSRTNEMLWVLAQMVRWGLTAFPDDPSGFIARVYSEEVLREAAAQSGMTLAEQDSSPLQAVDGPPFDPANPFDYLDGLEIRRDIALTVTPIDAPMILQSRSSVRKRLAR